MRTWNSWMAKVVFAALALMMTSVTARAHPHVWIDARAEVIFDEGQRITALRVTWRFDEFYSLFAIEGLDKNGDGKLDAAELRPLAELNVTSLKEHRYFTYVSAAGAEAAYGPVTEYRSTFEDGILSLDFVIPLEAPVDPRTVRVSFTSYDPTFYIALEPPLQDPVSFAGAPSPLCRAEVEEGNGGETLSLSEADFVNPTASEGLGALYATKITIVCDPAEATQ